jgi:hypothetical protein
MTTYKTRAATIGDVTVTVSKAGKTAAEKVQALIEAIGTDIENGLPEGGAPVRPDQGLPPSAGTKPIDPDAPHPDQGLPGQQPEVDNSLPQLAQFLKSKAKEIAAEALKDTLCDPAKPK